MDFKLGAFLIISAQICTTLALAPCVCTGKLSPVCGSDGKTYANECLLECAAYSSNTLIASKPGPCRPLPPTPVNCVCPYMYSPVCGTDGETYGNECVLSCQKKLMNPSLDIAYPGSCVPEPEEPTCRCPAVYSPVCGSDGIMYANECSLVCAMLLNPELKMVAPPEVCLRKPEKEAEKTEVKNSVAAK